MQSRSGLIVGALVLVCMAGFCYLASNVYAAGIAVTTFAVTDDSSSDVIWVIGDTAETGEGVRADFDTSITYDAKFWETMTMQAKFRPSSAFSSLDSGAVTIMFQMSNDQLYWLTLDSLVVPDSLAAFKNFTMQPYRYSRFIVRDATKTDSAGVRGKFTLNTTGRW